MDSNSSNVNLPIVGGYVLENLVIKTHTNVPINLAGRFEEINIYESMTSPIIFGDILVVETYNFISFGPLLGGEELTFTCSNIPAVGERTTRRNTKFVIYAIENKVYTKDKMGSYLIRFCSKEAIYNQQIRICSTIYKKPFSDIAHDIFSAFFAERSSLIAKERKSKDDDRHAYDPYNTDKVYRTGNGKEEQIVSMHFPNLHPFECLQLLAGRACLKPGTKFDHGNPFFFFEQLDNTYVFMSWVDLIKEFNYSKPLTEHGIYENLTLLMSEDQKRNKYIFMSLPSIWGSEDKNIAFDWFRKFENFVTVEQHKFQKDFDFFENIKKGMYASTLVSYDNCSKKIVKHSWTSKKLYSTVNRVYDEQENKLNIFYLPSEEKEADLKERTPGKRPSEYLPEKHFDSYVKATPTADQLLRPKIDDFCPELTKNLSLLKLQELNNTILHVNIPGNLNYTVGTFTDVFMHSHDETLDSPRRDPHFAGTYVNLRVRHTFNPTGFFFTSLELAKDSFIDKTIQSFPIPKKPGT